MDNLNAIFTTEAQELITELEKALLKLEKDPGNKEDISSIFRAMHTLKGSAGMFGFESIGRITHHLESIYENIRTGKNTLTQVILGITLKSVDHLKKLLDDGETGNAALKKTHEDLLQEIAEAAWGQKNSLTEIPSPYVKENAAQAYTYYIHLHPQAEILKKGANTLYLLEDLLALGDGICLPFFTRLPAFGELQPDLSYMDFEVVLGTEKTEQEIRDVFMFVEESCEVTILKIGDGNLLKDPEVMKELSGKRDVFSRLGEERIVSFFAIPASTISRENNEVLNTKNISNVRVASERLDEFMNLVSELVTTQASLSLHTDKNKSPALESIAENVEKITRRLRDNAFMMSLIPIESLAVRYQRLVRDLSKELNKDVVFKTEGSETEIDKSIIERLTDPLMHLLRNSLDHGIETPDLRKSKGKPLQGTLLLKAYYSGANVVIEIKDDGAGVDLEKVRAKAIKNGLIAPDSVLNEKELIDLIFMPGFSTADEITGVSGRGVGMDVVRRNINDIRGDIEVLTKKDEGTTFSIRLPLTLSIINGLLVRIGPTNFILPLSSVNKCYEVETKILEETFNQWVTLEGQRVPFLFLRREFDMPGTPAPVSRVIKITYERKDVAIVVDHIVGEYQAVLKPLGEFYRKQDEFSGSTILGDGSVALVVDPYRLFKKFLHDNN